VDGTSAAAVVHVALNMAAQRCSSVHSALCCPSLSCCALPTLSRPPLEAFNVAQACAVVELCFAALFRCVQPIVDGFSVPLIRLTQFHLRIIAIDEIWPAHALIVTQKV
jgi:hypothetical protein